MGITFWVIVLFAVLTLLIVIEFQFLGSFIQMQYISINLIDIASLEWCQYIIWFSILNFGDIGGGDQTCVYLLQTNDRPEEVQ